MADGTGVARSTASQSSRVGDVEGSHGPKAFLLD
jgi:hypothetical protein